MEMGLFGAVKRRSFHRHPRLVCTQAEYCAIEKVRRGDGSRDLVVGVASTELTPKQCCAESNIYGPSRRFRSPRLMRA
jgi:hypothetical protein